MVEVRDRSKLAEQARERKRVLVAEMMERRPVRRGDLIDWYPDADENQEPLTAIVTLVGMGTVVNCNIFSPDNSAVRCRDGVRHVDHPRARDEDLRYSGAWNYSDEAIEQYQLQKKVAIMAADVDALAKKKG